MGCKNGVCKVLDKHDGPRVARVDGFRVNWGEVQVARDQLREAADILGALELVVDRGDMDESLRLFFSDRITAAAGKIRQALEAGADSPATGKGGKP